MIGNVIAGIVRHPWRVLVGWLVVTVSIIAFSPDLDDYVTGDQQAFLPSTFESVTAQQMSDEFFPATSGAGGTVVIARDDGAPLTPDQQQRAVALAGELTNAAVPGVGAVTATPRSLSPDGRVAALGVNFTGRQGDDVVNSAVQTLRSDIDAALAGTGMHGGVTGNAAIAVDTAHAYDGAEKVISIATVLIIVLLLGAVFRSPIIALIPIVVIAATFAAAQGLTAWAADVFGFQVSTSLSSIMIVVLFGVGADYIVFLLFRYRERLRDGVDPASALAASTASVGRVIASSALTVIGAFAALFLADLGSLTSLAPGLIIAVAYMLFTALTVVPAVFALLGRTLFWPAGPGVHRESRFGAVGTVVSRRPAAFVGIIAVTLAALGAFATGYHATYDTLSELPDDTPAAVAYAELATVFPSGALSPAQVFVEAEQPLGESELQSAAAALSQVPGVASVVPPQLAANGTVAAFNVILAESPFSATALDTVAGPVRDAAHAAFPDAQVAVGGQTAVLADVRSQLNADTALVFPVAALIVVAILVLLLRSLLAPLGLIVAVALTFAATLGVLTLIFLHGMGFDGVDFTTPVVLYLFVVAIGTDYNILMAERVREEFRDGKSPRESARIAISMDAPTVAVAGVILAATFGSLALTGLDNLVELGTGVAVGVALASLVMAPVLIPALSALVGRPFWWPTRGGVPDDPPDDEVIIESDQSAREAVS
ncbi:MMPL family transporter [Rhodococcus sp. IEGM 1379]|uniref:MMPL family transporter n=1 Tax=Rhodococcus sp. IEGM 1379 TaxID=3047086 RepID=UPI0024B76272|nr:MMPL family transporter [Rhodococcus sp. IEGM 1379]MDI9915034.1 MMPL family transporter [Rhodococcus sp. IEGM 1379]